MTLLRTLNAVIAGLCWCCMTNMQLYIEHKAAACSELLLMCIFESRHFAMPSNDDNLETCLHVEFQAVFSLGKFL